MQKIKTLKDLKRELSKLYSHIRRFCLVCQDEDCKGYIWLLESEAKDLEKIGISIVEINKKINFIDSFFRIKDVINLEIEKPPCILRNSNKKCSIYRVRPLSCRLYPIDFKIIKRKYYIILRTDCLFIKHLRKNNKLNIFLNRVIEIFYNCNHILLKKILKQYEQTCSVLKYPPHFRDKDYFKILKVDIANKKTKLEICPNAKQFLILKKSIKLK